MAPEIGTPPQGVRPKRVTVVEVGPRDGLQNQSAVLSVDAKVGFIASLIRAGLQRVEVAAFVHPAKVPQMADAEAVWAGLSAGDKGGARLSALVPNRKGFARAVDCGVRDIAVVASATETFNQRNLDATTETTLREIEGIIAEADGSGIPVRAYLSVAFVCPYEGRVRAEHAALGARRLLDSGAREIALSDTIGAAGPDDVSRVLDATLRFASPEQIALHFHDTRGTALANVLAALAYGICTFDSSAGGLGGCPFAPGALGNVATEDLIYMLDQMGIETGVFLPGVIAASRQIESLLGGTLPSRVLRAGGAPALRMSPGPSEAGVDGS
ncbi:MAG: hydroxymethylglutaryl-CoA lyase [bacterium]